MPISKYLRSALGDESSRGDSRSGIAILIGKGLMPRLNGLHRVHENESCSAGAFNDLLSISGYCITSGSSDVNGDDPSCAVLVLIDVVLYEYNDCGAPSVLYAGNLGHRM